MASYTKEASMHIMRTIFHFLWIWCDCDVDLVIDVTSTVLINLYIKGLSVLYITILQRIFVEELHWYILEN